MSGIEVQVTEQGPAKFEAVLVTPDGASGRLSREDRSEIQELAFREVLDTEVRPLPAGAIRFRCPCTPTASRRATRRWRMRSRSAFSPDGRAGLVVSYRARAAWVVLSVRAGRDCSRSWWPSVRRCPASAIRGRCSACTATGGARCSRPRRSCWPAAGGSARHQGRSARVLCGRRWRARCSPSSARGGSCTCPPAGGLGRPEGTADRVGGQTRGRMRRPGSLRPMPRAKWGRSRKRHGARGALEHPRGGRYC
jgi:hypothetical protein